MERNNRGKFMRIIGYENLKELDKLEEWDEIKEIPHLCISKTLSNGILRHYKKEELGIVTTIDKVIRSYFKEWVNGKKEVHRLLKLVEFINEVKDRKIRNSFKRSKNTIYNTIKMCVECDIKLEEIEDFEKDEERYFIELYKKVLEEELFNISILNRKKGWDFKSVLYEVLDEEIKKNNENEEYYKKIREKIIGIDRVILHGVHKFTPLILKLVEVLEANEIEVIFLINYNGRLKNIYKTWREVYRWTNLEIEECKSTNFKINTIVAENYKNIFEGRLDKLNRTEKIKVTEFNNYTEMSNYICEKNECGDRESFFSADANKINDILKNYYIEQFKERHFLAFPEGQFILGIFNMFNEETNEVSVEIDNLEEVLMTGFLDVDKEAFDKVKGYLENLNKEDLKDYIERLESLIEKIEKINEKDKEIKQKYRKIGYYNLTIEEVKNIKTSLEKIEGILEVLRNREEDILKKYKNVIIEASEQRGNRDIEKSMLDGVYKRLKKMSSEEEKFEFKDGIYYYLKKEDENKEKGAIVKDFYHIEGGILSKNRVYHFMDISDGSMQKTEKNIVWPLDIDMVSRKNKNFSIVKKSLDEENNYLKYALFYGIYFTENNIKISYVKNKGKEKKDELYFIFKFMNIELQKEKLEKVYGEKKKENKKWKEAIEGKLNSNEKKISDFCEKRFTYEVLFDLRDTYKSNFLIKKYLVEFIKSKNRNIRRPDIEKLAEHLCEVELDQMERDIKKGRNLMEDEIDFLKDYNNKECTFCKYKGICK